MKREKLNEIENGITLISLVITIIILLMLVGVTINLIIGEDGIFGFAQKASKNYLNSQEKELSDLEKLYSQIKVATNDGTVTLSMEDLNKIIDEKVEKKVNNIRNSQPKKLTTITLPNTGSNSRGVGAYSTNTTSFTKQNTQDFNEYLLFDEQKGWTIKKSGMYLINCIETVHFNNQNVDTDTSMLINENKLTINRLAVRDIKDYKTSSNNTTVFLEEGVAINFIYTISSGSPIYNSITINLYAL